MDELKIVLDKFIKIVSEYKHEKYTGSISLILNLSQGGLGTVIVEFNRRVKDVNRNGTIRIISEESLK